MISKQLFTTYFTVLISQIKDWSPWTTLGTSMKILEAKVILEFIFGYSFTNNIKIPSILDATIK